VLPQVLAGLGIISAVSAGCLLWLQKLQPLFFAAALGGLGYEAWLVLRRPAPLRTTAMKTILGASVVVNAVLIISWVALWFRYR
jgi:hypothetical protein